MSLAVLVTPANRLTSANRVETPVLLPEPPSGGGLYVTNDIELQSYLESIGATFNDWNNDIIPELGYANYNAANSALYTTGILKTAIDAAWAALNP